MQSQILNYDTYTEIEVKGRIDASTVASFEAEVLPSIADVKHILILNLADVEYMSSAGLRAVLKIAKETKSKNIVFACTSLQSAVFDVFKISGFSSIVKIFGSTQEALSALKG